MHLRIMLRGGLISSHFIDAVTNMTLYITSYCGQDKLMNLHFADYAIQMQKIRVLTCNFYLTGWFLTVKSLYY